MTYSPWVDDCPSLLAAGAGTHDVTGRGLFNGRSSAVVVSVHAYCATFPQPVAS